MSTDPGTIVVDDVSKMFGATHAVRSVSLSISGGEFFSLLGPSGCGKTTLLRMLSGFERPDQGTISIGDLCVDGLPPNRRPTAMVFQRWALFPHLTVSENVSYGLRVKGLGRRAALPRVSELLELVGLTGLSERKPAQLSGGQQQRVALARALAIEPRVLLLDEPLSSLDLKLRDQMRLELKRLQRELGMTFVYVTHDQGEAMTMSDTVAVMHEGRVLQAGSPQGIYDRPTNSFVAGFIGDTNLVDLQMLAKELGGYERLPRIEGREAKYLSLRYERVLIGHELTTEIRLNAKVLDVIFGGARIRYRLQVDGTAIELIADVPYQGEGQSFAQSEAVQVGWRPGAAVALDAS